jgi:hypothetical protein
VDASAGLAWSNAVGEADWIRERLSPFDAHRVTSVVLAGFEAYARVLHPACTSRMPSRLAGLARAWTTTPGHCWFCLWDGYDLAGTLLTPPGEPSVRLRDPVPGSVREGPRVNLPNREYLLYPGPVEAVTGVASFAGLGQTPNLWWPADRAWCVATEIDLPWTYLAGPAGLIDSILHDRRVEALPASPTDPLTHVEAWVAAWVNQATAALLSDGETVISTSRGTVHAWLTNPARFRHGMLRTQTLGDNGVDGTSATRLSHCGREDLRDEISFYLTAAIIGVVGAVYGFVQAASYRMFGSGRPQSAQDDPAWPNRPN